MKYREYFDIDEKYFPCIDDSAINAGAPWNTTYPHEAFVNLLKDVCRMLDGSSHRSVWIEGAYGTGKSQCAYALKKILEVPESELRDYWERFDPLKKDIDLLERLIGHKQRRIVTAYRYASGGVDSPRALCFAVQESIKKALEQAGAYTGENTLKESVVAWLEDPLNKDYFNKLLDLPRYSSLFTQSTADEVINALRKGSEVKELMHNIFALAEERNIKALDLSTDRLVDWLKDVIDHNGETPLKIVLVWDEFSDYFKCEANRNSLGEFQKIAALCQSTPFYLIVVTHQTKAMLNNQDQGWNVVRQRFDFTTITLPDNIAFNLIGHAFSEKPSAHDDWVIKADELNSRLNDSRKAVMKAANITDVEVIKKIMPLHPVTTLALANIATAYKANQRSMFDFIKTDDTSIQAFQWFIEHTGPEDDYPLLTVDMLWNFFYEKGRNDLTADIQAILATFAKQQSLNEKQKIVLKAILIMQAIDQKLGGAVDLFRMTEPNLRLCFEGIDSLEGGACVAIAKSLVQAGILFNRPIENGKTVFAAAALAGDQSKIDKFKEDIRASATTAKLVAEGGLATVIQLTPALKLRFDEPGQQPAKLAPVTVTDFTRVINGLRDKPADWHFTAVIALAANDNEVVGFRRMIQETAKDKQYENIIIIDALSAPLGADAFEEYVDYSAMAKYYSGNDTALSKNNDDKAKRALDNNWKNNIYNGAFIVYSSVNTDGERVPNGQSVLGVLQSVVQKRFHDVFDFAKGLTESMLRPTQLPASARCGIVGQSGSAVAGIEKCILPTVWTVKDYWEQPQFQTLPIVKIKKALEKKIANAFAQDGQISIGEIYDLLETDWGFAPCNMSAFLCGFLLKEYAGEPYRYQDANSGHDQMSSDKLKEMIGKYINEGDSPKYKRTYIIKMTADEMAFYSVSETAWSILQNSCSSAGHAALVISQKMKSLQLPIWCLDEVDDYGVFDVVEKYIELVQKEGKEAHQKALEIGKIAGAKPTLGENLSKLMTKTNCQNGMRQFLVRFENGKILELAKEIGATDNYIDDVRKLFDVEFSYLWLKDLGEEQIRTLLTDYGIVRESNIILSVKANSRKACFAKWRERLNFVRISAETAKAKFPALSKLFDLLLKIAKQSDDLLPEQLKSFHSELISHSTELTNFLNEEKKIFADVYESYLDGLSENDIAGIMPKLPQGFFTLSASDCNIKVKEQADLFRKGQLKTKLLSLWKEKSGEKNPREWSYIHKTPILCMVSNAEFDAAKKTFETLNRFNPTDPEIKAALTFLETATFLADVGDENKRIAAFVKGIIGEYAKVLTDVSNVRDVLDHMTVEPYDWFENPNVKAKVRALAEAEYNAGGSAAALQKIDQMDDATLKAYLKRLVKENMSVGIEIITNGDGTQ